MRLIPTSAALWLGFALLQSAPSGGRADPPLTITSPHAGDVVYSVHGEPGIPFTVEVTRAPGSGIDAVAVHGITWTAPQSGADPLIFEIALPADTPTGPIELIAYDASPGAPLENASAPVRIQVEPVPLESNFWTDARALRFNYPGEQKWLDIGDGDGFTKLNDSSWLRFGAYPSVVRVDRSGLVTATGAGSTSVSVNFTHVFVPAEYFMGVPVTVAAPDRGDFNGNHIVDREDISILRGEMETGGPSIGANDARDLNADGAIDELDVAVVRSLCSFPDCAERPSKPPRADAGGDRNLQCAGPAGSAATLDGSASASYDGSLLDYRWSGPFGVAAGATPTVRLPVGAHSIVLDVTSGSGDQASDSVTVTVVDTAPPKPRGALQAVGKVDDEEGLFRVSFRCSDRCDGHPAAAATLNGIAVQAGQLVELERNKHRKVKEAKRGKLLHLEAPAFSLEVSCADASGNTAKAVANAEFPERHGSHGHGSKSKGSHKKGGRGFPAKFAAHHWAALH